MSVRDAPSASQKGPAELNIQIIIIIIILIIVIAFIVTFT